MHPFREGCRFTRKRCSDVALRSGRKISNHKRPLHLQSVTGPLTITVSECVYVCINNTRSVERVTHGEATSPPHLAAVAIETTGWQLTHHQLVYTAFPYNCLECLPCLSVEALFTWLPLSGFKYYEKLYISVLEEIYFCTIFQYFVRNVRFLDEIVFQSSTEIGLYGRVLNIYVWYWTTPNWNACCYSTIKTLLYKNWNPF